jgi:hypothetical protein
MQEWTRDAERLLRLVERIEESLESLNVGNEHEEVNGAELVDAANIILIDIRNTLKDIG